MSSTATTGSNSPKRQLANSSGSGDEGSPNKRQMTALPSSMTNLGATRLRPEPTLQFPATAFGGTTPAPSPSNALLLQQLQLQQMNQQQVQLLLQQQRQQQVLQQLAMVRSLQAAGAASAPLSAAAYLTRPPAAAAATDGASWLANLLRRPPSPPSSMRVATGAIVGAPQSLNGTAPLVSSSNSNMASAAAASAASWTTDSIPVCLPAAVQGSNPHWQDRTIVSLATDEDANWLSEYQCFLRSQVLEVFRASADDLMVRNNSKSLHVGQVGVRCRYCAHVAARARAPRSSAFPSSIAQIYQSFTMMLREHFGHCTAMPHSLQEQLEALRKENLQGASDAKKYWVHAARKMGLFDTADHGMDITDASRLQAAHIQPFGMSFEDNNPAAMAAARTVLVAPQDTRNVPEYLQTLFEHVQVVTLAKSERVGNRKTLAKDLPGLGCKHCAHRGRLGLCRVFPARRRALPTKVEDLYQHLKRCPLIAVHERNNLVRLHNEYQQERTIHKEKQDAQELYEREFFHRLWTKLGHSNKSLQHEY